MHGFQLIGKIARTNFGEALITAHWKNRAHQFLHALIPAHWKIARAPIAFTRGFQPVLKSRNLCVWRGS